MADPRVHVSVSVVADGERIGQFDSDTEPEADDSPPADSSRAESVSPDAEADTSGSDVEAAEPTADIDDSTDTDAPAAATFELYRDKADEWRWRLRHRNGNIIADGGEGYSSKSAAKNGIESVKKNAAGASLVTQ